MHFNRERRSLNEIYFFVFESKVPEKIFSPTKKTNSTLFISGQIIGNQMNENIANTVIAGLLTINQ